MWDKLMYCIECVLLPLGATGLDKSGTLGTMFGAYSYIIHLALLCVVMFAVCFLYVQCNKDSNVKCKRSQ